MNTYAFNTAVLLCAAMDVTAEYLRRGIKFSWPVYKSGLKIMVAAGVEQPQNLWAFSRPFSTTIWLAMGATALGVGLWIMSAEYLHHRLDNVLRESE
jgi:hypothetical protein